MRHGDDLRSGCRDRQNHSELMSSATGILQSKAQIYAFVHQLEGLAKK